LQTYYLVLYHIMIDYYNVVAPVSRIDSYHTTDLTYTSVPSGYPKLYFHNRPGAGPIIIDDESVGIQVYLFKPGTLILYLIDPYFQPHLMLQHVNIQDVPSYITWTNRQKGEVAFKEIPEPVSDQNIEKAVRLARYVSFEIHGKVMKEISACRLI